MGTPESHLPAGGLTPVPEVELVFEQAIEGLFKMALRPRMTEQLEARLLQAGLDLSRPLRPAYPRAEWNDFVRIAAESLWPGKSPEVAYRELGRALIDGYTQTLMGKAIASIVKLIGPRRMLERMTRNLRSGGNFNLTRVTDLAPQEVEFWINEPYLHPAYVAGMLEAALQLSGAKGVALAVLARDGQGCTYRIHW